MTTNNAEKNYAPLWKKLTVVGAIVATVSGLTVAQNLASVSASEKSEYLAVTDFAAGNTQATIITEDGKTYARGWNNEGQLGVAVGSKVNVSEWTEVAVPEKIVDVETNDHTVALGESGKLYTWGANANGQVGNGNTSNAFTPVQITAVDRYSKIASGAAFTVALDEQGRLWSWGANNVGQLGDGSTANHAIPKMVSDEASFTEVYAAKETAYALTADGTLWAWGANNEGQIGDGTTDNRNKPTMIRTIQKWSQLAVSQLNNTVLAVDLNGELYSWGSNNNALLGNGTDWRKLQEEENQRFRAMIEQIERDDAARKEGLINKCADEQFAIAYSEYEEEYEKVSEERDKALEEVKKKEEEEKKKEEEEAEKKEDDEEESPSPTPTPTPSASKSEKPIPNPDDLEQPERSEFLEKCATEVEKTFAKTDTSGMKPAVIKEPELKPGHAKPEEVSTEIIVEDIAVGSENAYLVDGLGRLFSWGKDANGQTGLDLEDEKSHTQVPVLAKEGVSKVAAGDKYGAALANNGDLLLWGLNTNGVLLSKDTKKILTPTVKGSGYSDITAGLTTVYGFKGKSAYAWGNNANGELGTGSGEKVVYEAFRMEQEFNSIAPAHKGAVALGSKNELLYWGVNESGQFGNNATSANPERNVSSNEVSTFTTISAADNYTTAVSSDGRMWGWGSNEKRLLDLTSNGNNRVTPTAVSSGFAKVTEIAAGNNVSAMTNGSVLVIWHDSIANTYELENIVDLAAGDNHVLVRTQDGKVWNWSLDGSGVPAGTEPGTLVLADENRVYESIEAGGALSGAITADGETVIWGAGSENLRLSSEEGSPVENFKFAKMSISNGYIIASDENRVLWGWGENAYGVLGTKKVSAFPSVLTKMEENNEKEGK